jgi:hypothetical protein
MHNRSMLDSAPLDALLFVSSGACPQVRGHVSADYALFQSLGMDREPLEF